MENEVKRSPNYIPNFPFKWVRTQKNHGTTLVFEGLFVPSFFVP